MSVPSVLGALCELERSAPDVPVVMEKRLGLWRQRTRGEVVGQVATIAAGLATLPVGPGDVVLLWAADHADWLALDLAVQAVGAAVCPLVDDATPDQLRHALVASGARVVVVDDQEHADEVLDLLDDTTVVVDHVLDADPSGLHGLHDARLSSLSDLVADVDPAQARARLEERVGQLAGDTLAVRVLTGGTTSEPRAVDLSHGAVLAGARAVVAATGLGEHDRVLSFRPLADPTERTTTIAASLLAGALLALPESRAQVSDAMYEVAPTYVHVTRRWVDRTAARVVDRLQGSRGIKGLFARRWVRHVARGQGAAAGRGVAVRYPVLEKLGLDRVRTVVLSGSLLGAPERAFTTALGLPVRNAYALAEAGGVVTLAEEGRLDDLGAPLAHVELALDADGQVLVAGPGVGGAQVPTGDRGELTDGRLVLDGRLGDRAEVAGTVVDLARVEARMRDSAYVREAVVVHADGRTVAVVELAEEPLQRWATREGITYATFRALTTTDEVQQLVRSELDPVATETGVGHIDDIRVLPASLDHVEGALTPSGRVRRRVVASTAATGGSPVGVA